MFWSRVDCAKSPTAMSVILQRPHEGCADIAVIRPVRTGPEGYKVCALSNTAQTRRGSNMGPDSTVQGRPPTPCFLSLGLETYSPSGQHRMISDEIVISE